MKTHTSKTRAWLKSLIVLPLLAVLIYSFSSEKIEYREVESETVKVNNKITSLELKLDDAGNFYYQNKLIKIEDLKNLGEFENGLNISVTTSLETSRQLIDEKTVLLRNYFGNYGLKNMGICFYSEKDAKIPTQTNYSSNKKIDITISENGKIYVNNILTDLEKIESTINGLFTNKEKHTTLFVVNLLDPNTEMGILTDLKEQLRNLGYSNLKINTLEKNAKIPTQTSSKVELYNKLSKNYTDALAIWLKGDRKDNSNLRPLKNKADKVYLLITTGDKVTFKLRPTPPLPADYNSYNQEGITEKELKKYNLWAIKVNGMIANDDNIIVKIKDLKYMKNLYERMTVTQQKSAEPFPNFPPPPPPPAPIEVIEVQEVPSPTSPLNPNLEEVIEVEEIIEEKQEALNNLKKFRKSQKVEVIEVVEEIQEPKTGFITINEQTLYYVKENGKTRYFNRWGQKVDRKGNIIDPEQTHAEDVIKGRVVKKVYKSNKVIAEFDTDNVSIPAPPPPPPTPNMEKLAEKGATFYYEGKKISSKEAIKIYKENSELNVLIKDHDTKPIVKLSKEPIEAFPSKNKKHYKLKSATVYQDSPTIKVNGKNTSKGRISLTKKELKSLELYPSNGKITSYKIKFPGKPTQHIKSTALTTKVKGFIESATNGTMVQIFDIKTEPKTKRVAPILITISE